MPSREQTHYFGAGPAPLPTSVLEAASSLLLNYSNLGIGLGEISHRSPEAAAILSSAKDSLYALLDIDEQEYDILFLQGGGSGQFSAVVYHMVSVWVEEVRRGLEKSGAIAGGVESEERNFRTLEAAVRRYLRCDYLVTGSWSLKASQEAARLIGAEYVHVAVDSREHNGGSFGVIPDESTWKLDPSPRNANGDDASGSSGGYIPRQPAFTYYCDNETVDGVEFPALPSVFASNSNNGSSSTSTDPYLVADMSSNFLSRSIPRSAHSLIFAGAQKNLGLAGLTLTIIRRSLLPPNSPPASPTLLRRLGLPVGPIVFDFGTVAKNNSLYNTLPIFDVWVASEVLKGLRETHGEQRGAILGQERLSGEKSGKVYEALERWPRVYTIVPGRKARSRMNICVRVGGGAAADGEGKGEGDAGVEKTFVKAAEERGLTGLKGHRSVGGVRISNYNAVPMHAVDKLVQFLDDFAKDVDVSKKE